MFDAAIGKSTGTTSEHLLIPTYDEFSLVPVQTSRGTVYKPRDQSVNKIQFDQVHLVKAEGNAVSTLLSNPQVMKYELKADYIPNPIQDHFFHFVFTIGTGDVKLAPLPRAFRSITIRNSRNEKIEEILPESTMYYYTAMNANRESSDRMLEQMNSNKYRHNMVNTTLSNGSSYDFYLHFHSFLNRNQIMLPTIKDKIIIELEPETITANWICSGLSSYITVTNADLYIIDSKLPNDKMDMYKQIAMKYPRTLTFETLQRNQTTETLTASTSRQIQLTALHGIYSGLLIGIRPTITTYYTENYASLGLDGTINLKTKSGDKIIYNSDLKGKFLQKPIATLNYNNKITKYSNMYYLSFADLPQEQFKGGNHGFLQFSGDELLEIIPSATNNAETAESVTFVASITPDGGYFQLTFGGSVSEPIIFNANAATINAAIAKMQAVKDANILVSSTAITVATLTLSISNLDHVYKKYGAAPSECGLNFGMINGMKSATATQYVYVTYAVGTTGVPRKGIFAASGSTCYVDVLGVRQNTITITGGEIMTYN